MIQKLLSGVLTLCLLLSLGSPTFGSYSHSDLLENMGEYKQYAIEMGDMIPNLNKTTLDKVSLKLSKINSEDTDLINFVSYLELIIGETQNAQTTKVPKAETSLLNESENRKLQREIKKIEGNMRSELESFLDSTISSWNSMSRYEEKGNLKANIKYAAEDLMKLHAQIDISDYTSQVQVFDQSFDARLNGNYTTEFWGQEMNLSGDTQVSLISKGGSIYAKFENTKLTSSNQDVELEITPFLEKLNELGESGTYLAFMDKDSEEIISYLEGFNGSTLDKQIEEIFSKALFEAYAKNDTGYLLRPTKHFCDMGKKITRVFDPFGGKDCSDAQYQDMLEDFYESETELHLSLGIETVLSISNAQSVDAYEKIGIDFTWKNGSLKDMSMQIYDASNPEISYFDVNYIPKKSLHAFSNVPGDLKLDMLMKFNRDNSVKFMQMDMNIEKNITIKALYDKNILSASLKGGDEDFKADCSLSGELDSSYADLSSQCILSGDDVERELTGKDTVTVYSDLLFNGRSQKNDITFLLDAQLDNENYLVIDLSNVGSRKSSSKKEIYAPKKTVDYLDFTGTIESVSPTYDYDTNYNYSYEEYDGYTESCYTYDNGDKDCSKYYNNKSETCTYKAETGKETCSTYEYGYSIDNYDFDGHTTTCYNYDDGSSTCYEYYDDKTRTCNIDAKKDINCSETNY